MNDYLVITYDGDKDPKLERMTEAEMFKLVQDERCDRDDDNRRKFAVYRIGECVFDFS